MDSIINQIVLKNNISDHFTLITYPDGQHSIKLALSKLNVKEPISIKCRIRNFGELEVLLCLVTALRKYDFYIELIDFVYLFGMRSDRAFEIGEPNYFRDVIKPVLNILDCTMTFLAPHSIKQVENYYYEPFGKENWTCIISGDYSFYKNVINRAGRMHGYFNKKRKERIGIELCSDDLAKKILNSYDVLIVDDLCDGGATFIAEGEYLKKRFPNKTLKLFVFHGLFTQGIHPLLEYFDEIICTNSYQDIDHPKVKQIKVI